MSIRVSETVSQKTVVEIDKHRQSRVTFYYQTKADAVGDPEAAENLELCVACELPIVGGGAINKAMRLADVLTQSGVDNVENKLDTIRRRVTNGWTPEA